MRPVHLLPLCRYRPFRALFFLLFLLCPPHLGQAREVTLLPAQEPIPFLRDDMDQESLIIAATRHLDYLRTLPASTALRVENTLCSRPCLLESMESFIELLKHNPDPAKLDQTVRDHFTLHRAGAATEENTGKMLITGYYEPLLDGSLSKNGEFTHPLYAPPASLLTPVASTAEDKTPGHGDSGASRAPFWSRAEIEAGNLLAGNELVYLRDPVDAFVLHIQGSGKIHLPDGSQRALQFAATNGHAYRSIGKLLIDEGRMTREEVTMPAIRDYLHANPDERQRILHHNPRFIFFQWNDRKESPTGSMGLPLTPGRSIAVDPDTLPTGVMAYLVSRKPVLDRDGRLQGWETMQRFVLPQDTGAAIKGAGRADLFWGNGHYAETAAGIMKEEGQLYFLVKKEKRHGGTNAALATQRTGLP